MSRFGVKTDKSEDFIEFHRAAANRSESFQFDPIVKCKFLKEGLAPSKITLCTGIWTKRVNYNKNMQIVENMLQKTEEHIDLCKNTLFVKSGILNRGWSPNDGKFTKLDGLSRQI